MFASLMRATSFKEGDVVLKSELREATKLRAGGQEPAKTKKPRSARGKTLAPPYHQGVAAERKASSAPPSFQETTKVLTEAVLPVRSIRSWV